MATVSAHNLLGLPLASRCRALGHRHHAAAATSIRVLHEDDTVAADVAAEHRPLFPWFWESLPRRILYISASLCRLTGPPVPASPAAMASTDEPVPQDENLRLADLRYTASLAPTATEREEAAAALKAAIIDRKAVPLLVEVSAELVRFLRVCSVSGIVWSCSSVLLLVRVLPQPRSFSLVVSDTHPVFHVDLAAIASHPLPPCLPRPLPASTRCELRDGTGMRS